MPTPVPVEMPSPLPVNSKSFDLNYTQSMTPAGQGFIQTIERAPPAWVAKYSTPPLSPERDQAFQAFLDSLEGSLVPFLAYDPRRPRPWHYRNSPGEPWKAGAWPSIQVTEGNFEACSLKLQYFIAAAVLTSGDYLAFKIDNAWNLYRLRANAVSDGIGEVEVFVTPRPPDFFTVHDVRLVKAPCAMKIIGGVQKQDQVDEIGPKYTFQAVQYKDKSLD